MKKNSFSFFYCLIVFLLFISCQHSKQDTPTDGTTFIAVDETFAPVLRNEIDVFESIYKSAAIVDLACPEVDAFNYLMKDSVRMIVASRRLSKEETLYFEQKKIFPKQLKIATDGIVFVVHPDNVDSMLTTNTIKKIMLGEIGLWSQINPMSKLGPIKMIFDNPKSSIADYAVKTICGGNQLSTGLSALNSNREVIDFVSRTPNAIGIVGLSWISNHKDSLCMNFLEKVRAVALCSGERATKENSFLPYPANMVTGKYPFVREIYVIMTEPRVSLNTGFASFIVSDRGQRIILKSGILPATKLTREIYVKEDF